MRRGDSSVSASTTSDQETFPNGCFVRPIQVSSNAQRRVRALVGTPEWHLERRNGYVRPPRRLPCGRECAVADFGECGDRKCGNYRLGDKTWNVRPTFLDFCVDHILQAIPPATLRTGVVYCSLGSGQLLFDWELLERLTLEEGVRLRAVHLIDQDYGGAKRRESAVRAQRLLAGWFADQGTECGPCAFRSFLSAPDFQRWVLQHGESAHVLLDCDAVGARKRVDVSSFRRAAMRPGGICLVLSNPAKRTAIVKGAAARGERSAEGLNVLKQQVYRRGEWRHLASVSCSRSRSRRRRKRSRSRSRRRRRQSGQRAQSRDRGCRACACGQQRGPYSHTPCPTSFTQRDCRSDSRSR